MKSKRYLNKVFQPKSVFYFLIVIVFGVMLMVNCLTPYVGDDFAYFFSWKDRARLQNVLQIFESMYAHAFSMNGRLVPHFFVQLFSLMPKGVFNIVNAIIFCLTFILVLRNAGLTGKKYADGFLFVGAVAAYWYYMPAFGQVNLWTDGACNYLWALMSAVCFLHPFIQLVLSEKDELTKSKIIFYVVFSLLFGNFSESVSISAIVGAAFLLIAYKCISKKKIPVKYYIFIIAAFAGYVFMYLCPAEVANKAGSGSIKEMIAALYTCIRYFIQYGGTLFVIWGVLALVYLYKKLSMKKLLISFIVLLVAIGSDVIFMFASYYPERCMSGMIFFLIQADVILLSGLCDTKYEVITGALAFIMCVVCVLPALSGVADIYSLYKQSVTRNEIIQECQKNGTKDVKLPVYITSTKYSAANGLRDVKEEADVWPNTDMADYYGFNTIVRE